MTPPAVVLVTADPHLEDLVLTAAAALDRPVHTYSGVDVLPRGWARAPVVLIGVDAAPQIAGLTGANGRNRYLLGSDLDQLVHWSLPLGATPVRLPDDHARLSSLLGPANHDAGLVVAIVGGSGGVGASTLACGLALVSDGPSLLLDADPDGGGVDLLVGLETEPGLRWADLVQARGDLGELAGIPRLGATDVLSMSRPMPSRPDGAAVDAVLRAARRQYRRVWVDAGRGRMDGLEHVDRIVVVVAADVRSVAAARATVATLDSSLEVGLVVRRVNGGLPGSLVAEDLGLPAWGEIPPDRRLIGAAARGEPPHRGAGRRWRRACRRLVAEL